MIRTIENFATKSN